MEDFFHFVESAFYSRKKDRLRDRARAQARVQYARTKASSLGKKKRLKFMQIQKSNFFARQKMKEGSRKRTDEEKEDKCKKLVRLEENMRSRTS